MIHEVLGNNYCAWILTLKVQFPDEISPNWSIIQTSYKAKNSINPRFCMSCKNLAKFIKMVLIFKKFLLQLQGNQEHGVTQSFTPSSLWFSLPKKTKHSNNFVRCQNWKWKFKSLKKNTSHFSVWNFPGWKF